MMYRGCKPFGMDRYTQGMSARSRHASKHRELQPSKATDIPASFGLALLARSSFSRFKKRVLFQDGGNVFRDNAGVVK